MAEGRYLGDELTIHYGMIPRTNRGIVAINELPDLPERIQVSLFNILEERDVQIRGYRVRLDLDMLLVATANPDDYTHRGRIVSPLKDRFGTQVRTHYPDTVREEIRIMDQEVRCRQGACPCGSHLHEGGRGGPHVRAPPVAAREPSERDQRALLHRQPRDAAGRRVRRAARTGEPEAVPRVVDLPAVLMSSEGRVEFDTIEEGRETEILLRALRTAELEVFRRRLSGYDFSGLLEPVRRRALVDTGELTPAERPPRDRR